jgi:hypothetical protein
MLQHGKQLYARSLTYQQRVSPFPTRAALRLWVTFRNGTKMTEEEIQADRKVVQLASKCVLMVAI